MKFSDIIGHDAIKANLAATATSGRVSHAQLFVSDEGVGALPLAIAYAQRLLCSTPDESGDSCGECSNCYKMQHLEHPDCHFVYPVNKSKAAKSTGRADEKSTSDQFIHKWRPFIVRTNGYVSEEQWYEEIEIENKQGIINKEEANEILRKMSFKSVQGGYKIVIIWLPERMNEAAANTLLKLIEEPASGSLFLFVSQDPGRIIATIRSRTQLINLPPLTEQEVTRELQNQGFSGAARIASAASGSISRALSMAQNSSADENIERFMTLMRLGYQRKYIDLFEWSDQIAATGREAQKMFCEESLALLRDCYLTSVGMSQIAHTKPQAERFVANFSPYVNHLTVELYIKEFELVMCHVRQNGNPKIIFGDFALKISKITNLARK